MSRKSTQSICFTARQTDVQDGRKGNQYKHFPYASASVVATLNTAVFALK